MDPVDPAAEGRKDSAIAPEVPYSATQTQGGQMRELSEHAAVSRQQRTAWPILVATTQIVLALVYLSVPPPLSSLMPLDAFLFGAPLLFACLLLAGRLVNRRHAGPRAPLAITGNVVALVALCLSSGFTVLVLAASYSLRDF